MSLPSDFDSRLDLLDMLIKSLLKLIEDLTQIVERFESISERDLIVPKVGDTRGEWKVSRWTPEMAQDEERVIFISGRKIMLVPVEELHQVLKSKIRTLEEYELDTPEKRGALENLFSILETKKREKQS